jgi:glycosyltransferase involved in cell wall biosynthesis
MEPPLVSVIVATRNRADYLARALEGIAAQRFDDYEAIVVDDASNAPTRAQYRGLFERLGGRFRLHAAPHAGARGSGPSVARNTGIREARGRFLAFCDDDDYWRADDHLSTAVDVLQRREGDIFFADMCCEDEDGPLAGSWFAPFQSALQGRPVEGRPRVLEIGIDALSACMSHRHVHMNTVVARRDVVNSCGGFWESVRFAEDFDFVIRVGDRSRRILYRAEPVAVLNLTRHERAYSAADEMERTLIGIAVAHHVQMVGLHREVIACARRLESWLLLKLAEYARQRGERRRCWGFVLQSLSVRPSKTAFQLMLGQPMEL